MTQNFMLLRQWRFKFAQMNTTIKLALFGAVLSLGIVLAQQTITVLVNGKTSKLETLQKNGKVYVDGVAFAKALGANAKLEAGKLIVTTPNGTPYTQGTTQQAGGVGALGKSYTFGKENNALNFMLKSAEFSISRLVMSREIYVPKPNEKLLLLHCTIQNPQKQEAYLSNSQFKFTAVDTKGENHVYAYFFAKEGDTKELTIYLKPGQKIDVIAPIIVPASGTIPKLIAEIQQAGSSVVRYDLSKSIKPLSAPYADPKDPYSAPNTVAVKAGQYYPDKEFDFKLESVAFSNEKLDEEVAPEGKRFLMATFSARNPINTEDTRYLLGLKNELKMVLADVNGDIANASYEWYKTNAPKSIANDSFPQMAYNQEYRFRVAFQLPKDVNPKTLTVAGSLRNFVFDISSAK
jgi:hypothetical protein